MIKSNSVIIAMGRSAIGVFGGSLKSMRAHQLGSQVIKGVLKKTPEVNTTTLNDVILGECIHQCPDEANTARTAALAAGIPHEVPAVT